MKTLGVDLERRRRKVQSSPKRSVAGIADLILRCNHSGVFETAKNQAGIDDNVFLHAGPFSPR